MKIIALALLLVPSFASALDNCWYGADVAAAVQKSLSEMRSEDLRARPVSDVRAQGFSRTPMHDWKRCTYRRSVGRECVYQCQDGTEYRARQGSGSVTCAQVIWVRK